MKWMHAFFWAVYYHVLTLVLSLLMQVIYFVFTPSPIIQSSGVYAVWVMGFYMAVSFGLASVYRHYRITTQSPFVWALLSLVGYGVWFYYTDIYPQWTWVIMTYFYPWALVAQHEVIELSFNHQLIPLVWLSATMLSMWLGQVLSRTTLRLHQRYLFRRLSKQKTTNSK